MAITAVVGLKLANAGVPAFLVMIIMLLIGAVFGLLAGTLIEEFNMQPFIATLSTMFLARGLASIISTDSLTFPQGNDFSFISNVIKIIDNPKISNDLSFNVGVIIALVVVVFGYVFLHIPAPDAPSTPSAAPVPPRNSWACRSSARSTSST